VKKNITTLFLSIIFLIILLELFVRILIDNGYNYELEMMKYSNELKFSVIKNDGSDYLSHYPNKKTKIMGTQIETDENGYRLIKKNTKKNTILMLGDSMTFGFGANKTFSDLLNDELDDYNVINAGVGNTNTIMQINSFFDKDYKTNPNIIIINFFINDLEKVKIRKKNILDFSYVYNFLLYKLKILTLKYNNNFNYVEFYKSTFQDSDYLSLTFDKLKKLKNYCDNKNIILLVNFIPEIRQINSNIFLKEKNIIKNFLSKNNILFIDGDHHFKKIDHKNFLVHINDPHMNDMGHNEIFKYLLTYIIENKRF
jgi:hypothetical protein